MHLVADYEIKIFGTQPTEIKTLKHDFSFFVTIGKHLLFLFHELYASYL